MNLAGSMVVLGSADVSLCVWVFTMPDLVVCSRKKHTSRLAVSGQPKRTHLPTAGSCQPPELFLEPHTGAWEAYSNCENSSWTLGPGTLLLSFRRSTSGKGRNWDWSSLWVLCFSFSFTSPHLPYYHLVRRSQDSTRPHSFWFLSCNPLHPWQTCS